MLWVGVEYGVRTRLEYDRDNVVVGVESMNWKNRVNTISLCTGTCEFILKTVGGCELIKLLPDHISSYGKLAGPPEFRAERGSIGAQQTTTKRSPKYAL
ncbi:Protein of unknown function [Gryllus bimaculatus]|nr:Protein of unknown function [Gryllus bimaculatus]